MHDIMVVDGVRVERHLCERCAIREMGGGGAGGGGGGTIADPLKAAAEMSQQTVGMDPTTPEAPRALACGKCGLTFNEFKTDGKLGCASCYEAFVAQLGGILMRAHEGATHHAGKVPRRVAASRDAGAGRFAGHRVSQSAAEASSQERSDEDERMRQRAEIAARLVTLRKHLGEAVTSEQYERAARLRDEVRDLERELRAVSFGVERPETQA